MWGHVCGLRERRLGGWGGGIQVGTDSIWYFTVDFADDFGAWAHFKRQQIVDDSTCSSGIIEILHNEMLPNDSLDPLQPAKRHTFCIE